LDYYYFTIFNACHRACKEQLQKRTIKDVISQVIGQLSVNFSDITSQLKSVISQLTVAILTSSHLCWFKIIIQNLLTPKPTKKSTKLMNALLVERTSNPSNSKTTENDERRKVIF